ncbi:MAG: HD domain-containing protein [Candidatus Latescibacteria bacterium]|nr:HD domain-containing protein [Candidatus Latescibacterota bacterium]
MNDNVTIGAISEGDEFVGYYTLKRCELKETDGLYRLELELADKSGSLPAVVWNDAKEVYEQIEKGVVVKVKGRLGSYRDKPQVKIDKIRPAEESEYDPDSFLGSTPKDPDELKRKLKILIDSIQMPFLKKLIELIFSNQQFYKEYSHSPGGKRWHHVYLGGLLEHSIGVTEICDFVASQHPDLNRDLLITAGLLHDVGKIREFTVSTIIDYSDEGRLEGHIVMGDRFVRNMCDRVEGFPPHLKMLLSHLMLSHQGHKEYSSPVVPMIPEGFVLYFADEIDSKLNAVKRISDRTRDEGKSWSEYVKLLDRMIYVKPKEKS